jgi:hypothetical protein
MIGVTIVLLILLFLFFQYTSHRIPALDHRLRLHLAHVPQRPGQR